MKIKVAPAFFLFLAAAVLAFFSLRGLADFTTGEILSLEGTATINGHNVSKGAMIRSGDKLSLPADAKAVVRFGGKRSVALLIGAEVVPKIGRRIAIDLRKGAMASGIRRGSKFSVKTPLAAASVRGTVFLMNVISPDETYLCVCKGNVAFSAGGTQKDIQTLTHNAYQSKLTGSSVAVNPEPLKFHSDDDVSFLEQKLASLQNN